jgi:hypothetical protein
VADSHIRGSAEGLSFKLGSSFCATGYVKLNTILHDVIKSVKSEMKNLSENDVAVLCGGTLDVARNETMKGLSSVLQFVKNSEHTNMILMDAPYRFDLVAS